MLCGFICNIRSDIFNGVFVEDLDSFFIRLTYVSFCRFCFFCYFVGSGYEYSVFKGSDFSYCVLLLLLGIKWFRRCNKFFYMD